MGERLTHKEFEEIIYGKDVSVMYEGFRRCALEDAMVTIKRWCNCHPTCDGCFKNKEHIGCEFRGKSPREWKID